MADIELVIKIPQFLYKQILKGHVGKMTIAHIFKNGTPLPKGHGRLIDANEELYQSIRAWVGVAMATEILEKAPTIIEADKESKE